MVIVHVCETVPGGIGGFLDESLSSQIDIYNNVYIIVPSNQVQFFNSDIDGLKLITYKRKGRGIGSLLSLLKIIIKTYKNIKPDLFICHSTFSGLIVRLFHLCHSKYKNTKLIYYPHGVSMIMKSNSLLKNFVFSNIEKLLSKFATDKIVCVSNYEYSVMNRFRIPTNKLITIYNGISSHAPIEFKKKSEHEVVRILFVGRYDKEKGLHSLVKAINKLTREYEFRVIGGTTRGQVLPNLPKKTNNLGWLDRNDIIEQYKWADVVVVPSEWEALGLVAIEAMANKTSVIASKVGGLTEVVEHEKTGYLYGFEDEATLVEYLDNTPIHIFHAQGLAGYQRYNDVFSSYTMNQKANNLISELFSHKRFL